MSITVKNLTHVYSKNGPFERVALNNISFEIQQGDFVGLIGHTGSGKSTLIEHLNGLLTPDSGQIIIDGEDITTSKTKLAELRSKVGLVFQYPEYQLFEESVYRDIAYGPANMGLSKEEISRRVFEAADFVGLSPELMDKSPFDLSGGQKRRVAIAGIMAMEPSVLILDEPTAGLDPAGRSDLLARLKKLHKEKGTTIIIVSHSMEEIAETVEKVMVMSSGSLVFYGPTNEVFKKTELLRKIGLDVPQLGEIADLFEERGFPQLKDIYSVNRAADVIIDLFKGAKNA